MLSSTKQLQLSAYEGLYDFLIPKNHFLRKFNELVDFSFIYEELEKKYCLDNGRMAVSPILLFKYLLLKVLYNMSDADLVERSRYDMSFKYFLGLRPKDDVPMQKEKAAFIITRMLICLCALKGIWLFEKLVPAARAKIGIKQLPTILI